MKTYSLLRHLLPAVLFFPLIIHAETGSYGHAVHRTGGEGGGPVTANVPLNEVSIHAYRYFHKEWPEITSEAWYKTDKEFIVVFTNHSHLERAFFSLKGVFICSLEYYAGKDMAPEMAEAIQSKYPGYQIKVVTEVAANDKTAYYITLENSSMIKTLSIVNGKMEITGEMVNGDGSGSILAQN